MRLNQQDAWTSGDIEKGAAPDKSSSPGTTVSKAHKFSSNFLIWKKSRSNSDESETKSDKNSATMVGDDHSAALQTKAAPYEATISDYISPKEAKPIAFLRFAVVFVWLAAACCVSYGVFSYTKKVEFKQFEIQYQVDAAKVLESFHNTIDKRLGAANTLATALTIHAKYTNQTFPFVTMPDFVVPGSTARILADAAVIHWLPLVTDENREEWEEYAYKERHQVDEEFEKDEEFRRQEDIKLGLVDPEDRRLAEETDATSAPSSNSSWLVDNVVQDGSKYHYKIWSPSEADVIPDGSGPYLPIWQRSPVNAPRQATLNIDMGSARGLAGIFPYWSENKPRGALLQRAIIPHPNVKAFHDQILFSSQYRHHAGKYQNTPTTKLSYPVFDGFGEDANFVGVLATTLYWRLSFTDIFHYNSAQGLICVVENSFGQVFSYRVDGPNATYLGDGDPLTNNTGFFFEDMMVTQSPHFKSPRPIEERYSYTTLPLDNEYGEYKLKIYPTQDTYNMYKGPDPMIYTVVVASIFGLAAVVFLLYDFYVQKRHNTMMAKGIAQAHRAAVVEREAAVAERELNEYLAHEVRNPLAAALSACSFVNSAIHDAEPMSDEKSRKAVREDFQIINSSLKFINDLLRNMLDLYRAVNNQVKIEKKETDLFHDVLEPVASMLYCRDDNFELQLDCPKHLIVETDSLRLKQIILNLGRNAAKFVEMGYVRLRAEMYHDGEDQPSTVRIYVEDSGPGIPAEKRKALFAKFQQSLDLLSQGTGVGLCLCKQLIDIMDAEMWLDEDFDSGVEGCPGSRFIIDLKTSPQRRSRFGSEETERSHSTRYLASEQQWLTDINQNSHHSSAREFTNDVAKGAILDMTDTPTPTLVTSDGDTNASKQDLAAPERTIPDEASESGGKARVDPNPIPPLPEQLSVLFVDDDMVLRKLFCRSIKRLRPGWQVQEASSGETAIRLVDSNEESASFDIIFMDQYMASTEKQLLGTETTRELRAKGVKAKICGLSANNAEKAFLSAGADGFMMKPVPCDKQELERELRRLLNG